MMLRLLTITGVMIRWWHMGVPSLSDSKSYMMTALSTFVQ